MIPEDTCNFLATLAHPPWTKTLRHDRYMTKRGEVRMLFALYVQPSATTTKSLFLPLHALPAELQLRVLTFCSASTLFQLMRVSSGLRIEASKLFWAHSDAYFAIGSGWLLSGAHAGYTYDDLAFLAKVQNIEVDFEVGEDSICRFDNDGIEDVRQGGIGHFWNMLQKRCPRAKRVIFNQNYMSRFSRMGTHSVPRALQHLIRSSPSEITTCAFVVEDANILAGNSASNASSKWQRAVYQLRPDGSWEKTKSGQDWKTILVPAKQFSGPVGQYLEFAHRRVRLSMERYGLWPTLVEALARYYSDGGRNQPFSCPIGCDLYFEKAEEWTIHAAKFHELELIRDDFVKMFPEAIQGEFKERRARLAERREKIEQGVKRIREEWDRAGQEQKREIRRLWREQLDNDPLWETRPEDWIDDRLRHEFCQEFPYKEG